ncbi:MAG: hypothetical protein IH845_01040 [Nanoarchaeota archaeon]|nr:hypothetical protein [Nanoarchaeota archaeon]
MEELEIKTELYHFLIWKGSDGKTCLGLEVLDVPWEGDPSSNITPLEPFIPSYILPRYGISFSLPLVDRLNPEKSYDFDDEIGELRKWKERDNLTSRIDSINEIIERIYLKIEDYNSFDVD